MNLNISLFILQYNFTLSKTSGSYLLYSPVSLYHVGTSLHITRGKTLRSLAVAWGSPHFASSIATAKRRLPRERYYNCSNLLIFKNQVNLKQKLNFNQYKLTHNFYDSTPDQSTICN